MRLADLILDTTPYNAHTTGSDALYAGVPLLTLPGETFASRVGASLLNAIGLPELIAATPEAYVEQAVAIATDPTLAASLRRKLATQSATAPLFDMPAYTRALESAFATMQQRHEAGRAPEHIEVEP